MVVVQKTLEITNARSGNITQRLYTVKIPVGGPNHILTHTNTTVGRLTNSRAGIRVFAQITDAPLDEECTFTPAVTQVLTSTHPPTGLFSSRTHSLARKMAFEVDRSELPVHERLALHRSPSQREAFADVRARERIVIGFRSKLTSRFG